MEKRIYFIPQIIAFFFLSSLIVAFPYLLYTIYPALGMDFKQALGNSRTTFVLCVITLSALSLVIYRMLKPVNTIINNRKPGEITEDEKRQIVEAESRLKKFLIIIAITAFFIVGMLSVVTNALRTGFLLWATVRFFIVTSLTGPSTAFLHYIFVSYIIQKVKRRINLFEFKSEKRIFPIKWQIMAAGMAFFIATNLMMVFVSITRDEQVAGISQVALKIRENADVASHGYFTELLTLCSRSTDQAVRDKALEIKERWNRDAVNNMLYILYIGGISLLFFGFSLFVLATNIASHLRGITSKMKSFAGLEGDISSLVVKTSETEIGEIQVLFNRLILNINRTFLGILEALHSVTSGSTDEKENIQALMRTNAEIQETSRDINGELSRQSGISEKTTRSVRDVVDLIRQNLEKMAAQSAMVEEASAANTQLNASINSVTGITREAARLGTQLNATLQASLEAAGMMNEAITGIARSGSSITDIVSTISSIAGQSDLLAMNAAIEAAHAGVYGRGFAVVADEIRKLSETTAGYAKDIVKILNVMNRNIDNAVSCSGSLAAAMDKIQGDVNSTIVLIDEINCTSQEQLANSNENMQANELLLNTTHQIMENLEMQNRNNEQLLIIISEMEESTGNIKNVGKKQETYFQGLGAFFENFLTFFNGINTRLRLLNEKMSSVKLIDKSSLEQLTDI